MRIGYLVPEFPGQTHSFFWREAAAIEEAGAEIRFISTRRPRPEACPHAFREAAMARTRYLFPPSVRAASKLLLRAGTLSQALGYVAGLSESSVKARTRLFALLPVAAELLQTCRQEELTHVHIHSCADAAHIGALARIMGGPPYSLTLHGDLPVYGTDHSSKMARAAFVSAVTHVLAKQVGTIRPDLRRPMIWMGVDCNKFCPPNPPRQRCKTDRLNVVTVARLNHTKGHRYTLEAIAALLHEGFDIHYDIIGSGPEEDNIRTIAERLCPPGRVKFHGALSQDEIIKILQRSDALCLNSFGHGEAAPVTVMEAMACGLPVIVSKIGGTPQMILDGVNGHLVPQQNPKLIAQSIRSLVEDPEHARALGTAARRWALQKFEYHLGARKLLAEIERSRI